MISYGVGTLAFRYPFSRVFQDVLGESHAGPETFDDTVATAVAIGLPAGDADGVAELVTAIYPLASCLAEFVTQYTSAAGFKLGCGRNAHPVLPAPGESPW